MSSHMNLIPGIRATGNALAAEKVRLSVVAQNIANAHTTRDSDGGVYKRKLVAFEALIDEAKEPVAFNHSKKNLGYDARHNGVRVDDVFDDTTPGRKIYNPDHPHADGEGMVEMPNVEVAREMVDLISASRAYEANLSVARTARQMAMKAINLGR
jgi:flagellar basal-body rod protein FlgC